MKKQRIVLILLGTFVFIGSTSFADTFLSKPLNNSENLLAFARTHSLDPSRCLAELTPAVTYVKALIPKDMDRLAVEQDGKVILENLFQTRLEFHNHLAGMSDVCAREMKNYFRYSRALEDYISVYYYAASSDVRQIASETVGGGTFETPLNPAPLYDRTSQAMQTYSPAHYANGLDGQDVRFKFRNGDIMITKGVSLYSSSLISSLPEKSALFSHIVFMHVGAETESIESYIGKGVATFDLVYALKNENARILILRAKEPQLASDASDYIYNLVMQKKQTGTYIPYNYALDFDDHTKMSCEQVAYEGFKSASTDTVILPEHKSNIDFKDKAFLKGIGISQGPMMVPADMEIDSRFDIAADWTDVRLVRNSWEKDSTLRAMLHMMGDLGYKIHDGVESELAKVLWATRSIPWAWRISSLISSIPVDYTPDVPSSMIAMIAGVKRVAAMMVAPIIKADQEQYAKSGLWMSEVELDQAAENYRVTDLAQWKRQKTKDTPHPQPHTSTLHDYFRP